MQCLNRCSKCNPLGKYGYLMRVDIGCLLQVSCLYKRETRSQVLWVLKYMDFFLLRTSIHSLSAEHLPVNLVFY